MYQRYDKDYGQKLNFFGWKGWRGMCGYTEHLIRHTLNPGWVIANFSRFPELKNDKVIIGIATKDIFVFCFPLYGLFVSTLPKERYKHMAHKVHKNVSIAYLAHHLPRWLYIGNSSSLAQIS